MLKQKFEKWHSKSLAGEKDFLMICKNQKEVWGSVVFGRWEPLSTLSIIISRNNSTDIFYHWANETGALEPRNFEVIIKQESKLMLDDEKNGIISFGISEKEDDVEKIMIFLSNNQTSMFVAGIKDGKSIEVGYSILSSQETPLKLCWSDIVDLLREKKKLENESERKPEREVEKHVSTDFWY